jgi:hypothetical protein
MKTIHAREDGAPYIELFDFEGSRPLPITRIIVGPQKDQSSSMKEVEGIVGDQIEVHCSETPHLW